MSWLNAIVTKGMGLTLGRSLDRRAALLDDAEHWRRRTMEIQSRQLRGLLATAAGTEFGRGHEFARLGRLTDADMLRAYRSAVPLCDVESLRGTVARMREGGEPGVLWPGRVRYFAQTSGTTGGEKYIPVSREMLRSNYRASIDIFANALRFGVSLERLFGGKMLFLGGSTSLTRHACGTETGDLSGIVTGLIRWPFSMFYTPGKRVALMSDWPAKIEAMARLCVEQDVRMISGMPSWALVLFERMRALAREAGRRGPGGGPARVLRDLWPNLQLYVHGGVKYPPFDPRVRQAWSGDPTGPDVPARLEVYPASEAFVAMQDTRGEPALRLLSDIGNFFEFVPLERVHDPDPPSFTADGVEKGSRYVVVLSTCAGLWRYVLGDVVEFDSIPAGLDGRGGTGPCRLRIVGRHRHFVNAFGENLIVEEIERAVAAAARAVGALVGEFTAGPLYPGSSSGAALQVVVECEEGRLRGTELQRFGVELDAALKRQNVDYTTKRTASLGMGPPEVAPVPLGTFHSWMRSRGKLGGQHKCPRCANHREYLEGVLGFAPGGHARDSEVATAERRE
ncbi:MAG: GH3 auxin-responsive promoter family protein [Phycisphaerae bacterium]|nr:GH3 auxin-responsive promoter family protein [Phycisphaerae bacterium]